MLVTSISMPSLVLEWMNPSFTTLPFSVVPSSSMPSLFAKIVPEFVIVPVCVVMSRLMPVPPTAVVLEPMLPAFVTLPVIVVAVMAMPSPFVAVKTPLPAFTTWPLSVATFMLIASVSALMSPLFVTVPVNVWAALLTLMPLPATAEIDAPAAFVMLPLKAVAEVMLMASAVVEMMSPSFVMPPPNVASEITIAEPPA